jgi:carbon monoxide dehydrogenase subunit G
MKLAGQALLHAPLEQVWTALRDPAVLASTIPGCERLVETGPDSYAMTVTAGVASIKGSYAGTVSLADLPEPNTFLLKASGAGGPGTVNAEVTVTLTDVGNGTGTQLDYQADAAIGGVIGGVGQRMLAGVAKKLAGEFFAGVDDVLTGKQQPAAAQSGAAQTVSAQPASAQRDGFQPSVAQSSGPLVFGTGGGAGIQPAAAGNSFLLGAVFGAAAALLGVLVGARTARARLTDRRTR